MLIKKKIEGLLLRTALHSSTKPPAHRLRQETDRFNLPKVCRNMLVLHYQRTTPIVLRRLLQLASCSLEMFGGCGPHTLPASNPPSAVYPPAYVLACLAPI